MSDRSLNNKNLLRQIRLRAHEQRNGIFVPRHMGDKKTTWPVCMTCHREVESVNVEDISKTVVTIRATCHGKEAVIKMNFPYQILQRKDEETWEHVRTAINNSTFFEPSMA